MNERLFQRWGSRYILWMLISTRFIGVGGGALTIYYLYLTLEFSSQLLFHWVVIGITVVLFALTIQALQGVWETRSLRCVLWRLERNLAVTPEQARKAAHDALVFPTLHNLRVGFFAPIITTLPACLYMYWIVNASPAVLIHITIAAAIGTIACVTMIYFAMERMMNPVLRFLFNKGIQFDFENIPPGKLQNRMVFCFTMTILITVLMIVVLANQRAIDISSSPANQQQLIQDLRIHTIFISCGAILISMALAALLARFIGTRIQAMVQATHRIEMGDLSGKIEAFSVDEIGILGRSFNKMTEKLRHNSETISELNTSLERKVAERTVQLE